MVEWHLTPEYIIDNWTDEKLDLLIEKLVERKQREAQAMRSPASGSSGGYKVSDKEFFAHAKSMVKVVGK